MDSNVQIGKPMNIPIYKSIEEMSDAHLLSAIQQNVNVQKAHKPDSKIATEAREANRPYFAEAARRGLKGQVK